MDCIGGDYCGAGDGGISLLAHNDRRPMGYDVLREVRQELPYWGDDMMGGPG